MSNIKFTKEHEWLNIEGDIVTVGVTDFAQSQLGDVVFIELPEVGETYEEGDEGAVIESVKAAGEIEIPVSGEIVAVNEALSDDPELVNREPMSGGWFFKVKIAAELDASKYLDETAYKALIAEE